MNRIGGVYQDLGDPAEALEYHENALFVCRSGGDPLGEAITLNHIGGVYRHLSDPTEALNYHQEALSVCRRAGNSKGEAITLNHIGGTYLTLDDPAGALEHHRNALSVCRRAGNRKGEAITLNHIGNVYQGLDDPRGALDHFEQALPICRAENDPRGVAITLNHIGVAHQALDCPDQALASHREALSICRGTRDRVGEAITLNHIGHTCQDPADLDEALEHYEKALRICHEISDRNGEAVTRRNLALCYSKAKAPLDALASFQAAIDLVETLRAEIEEEDLSINFFASWVDIYLSFIGFLTDELDDPDSPVHRKLGDTAAEALTVAERSRARAFLDLILDSRAEALLGETYLETSARLQAARSRLKKLRRRIAGFGDDPAVLRTLRENEREVRDEVASLESETESMIEEIRHENNLDIPAADGIIDHIRDNLLTGKQVLLEYVVSEPKSILFVVTKDDFEVFASLPGRAELTREIEELRDGVKKIGRSGAGTYPHGRSLYEQLIGPARDLIEDDTELLISADGPLTLLPFSLLLEADPPLGPSGRIVPRLGRKRSAAVAERRRRRAEFMTLAARGPEPTFSWNTLPCLIRDHPIRFISSASAAATAVGGKVTKTDRLLLFAAPLEGATASARGGENRGRFRHLAHAREEVEAIADLARRVTVSPEFDPRATVGKVVGLARDPSLITHFSCHGHLEPDRPENSYLALEADDGEAGKGEPWSRLYARDIMELGLESDLVVLSACDTGHGKLIGGEGPMAITRSFMVGGARSVAATLWKVPDHSTRVLMERYYRRLLEGEDRTEALRRAQLSMMGEADLMLSNPHAWAAFCLTGAGGRLLPS